jgi:uncharacterized protein
MAERNPEGPPIGQIVWTDLTVEDAEGVRDFYRSVVGWRFSPCDMGGYEDFTMETSEGKSVAGVCHARGENAGLPAQWLVYVQVEDVEQCARRAVELGGELVHGPRSMGSNRFCVIRDPAGAVLALVSAT